MPTAPTDGPSCSPDPTCGNPPPVPSNTGGGGSSGGGGCHSWLPGCPGFTGGGAGTGGEPKGGTAHAGNGSTGNGHKPPPLLCVIDPSSPACSQTPAQLNENTPVQNNGLNRTPACLAGELGELGLLLCPNMANADTPDEQGSGSADASENDGFNRLLAQAANDLGSAIGDAARKLASSRRDYIAEQVTQLGLSQDDAAVVTESASHVFGDVGGIWEAQNGDLATPIIFRQRTGSCTSSQTAVDGERHWPKPNAEQAIRRRVFRQYGGPHEGGPISGQAGRD